MSSKRIDILDLWRTAAIICMLAYHFLFDLYIFGALSNESMFSPGLNIFERFIACSFILLSGIASKISRSNVKRGLETFACAILVSAGGYIAGQPIWFGVLHFLGLSMILSGLFDRWRGRVPGTALTALPPAAVCIALFFASKLLTQRTQTSLTFLFPLGFTAPGFSSADYFPLLPWFFLFLLGTVLGSVIIRHRAHPAFNLSLPRALTMPGRHSLVIYMLHQPVLYGLTYIIFNKTLI